MFDRNDTLERCDPAVFASIERERRRQEEHIEMIASENYASPAVMEAQGSVLTNKYAEGYPGKRYYGGCEYVDEVERLAIERAKRLFCEPAGVEMAVNVQPHSGAQANTAVFFALLEPGDTIMGLSLAEGGHLTHGMSLNISGKYFKAVPYGLDENEAIDYDALERLALEHRPKLLIAGASAYSLAIDFERMARIAHEAGALFMVDMAHYAGLVAAGVYPTPFGHADVVTTTTHKTLRGPRGGLIFMRPELEKKINSAVFPGTQGGPLMHVIAAKAVALGEALRPEFKVYQERVVENARVLVETLTARGLRIVSGGTQSHVMLVDLRSLHPGHCHDVLILRLIPSFLSCLRVVRHGQIELHACVVHALRRGVHCLHRIRVQQLKRRVLRELLQHKLRIEMIVESVQNRENFLLVIGIRSRGGMQHSTLHASALAYTCTSA